MEIVQQRLVPGGGARARLVACALAVAAALLTTLAVSSASATTRSSRTRRASLARMRLADAPEPQASRTRRAHSRHAAVRVREERESVREERESAWEERESRSRLHRAPAGVVAGARSREARNRRHETLHEVAVAAKMPPRRRAQRRAAAFDSATLDTRGQSRPAAAAPAIAAEATGVAVSRNPDVQSDAQAGSQPDAQADAQPRPQIALLNPALAHPSHEDLADAAVQPAVLPGLYRNGRLVMPAPLKGTHEILVHQNLMADQEGLERIPDQYELDRLRASHDLVDFPESASLRLNPELAPDRRCARLWTVHFAADIARAFYAQFHQPLQINSAVRTVQFQLRLERVNGNAAPVAGDVASPHLTGQAIDFGKSGMSPAEIAWMRAYLLPLMQAGKLDVEEEFQQACFHISVYRSYAPGMRRRPLIKTEVAQAW